MNRWWIRLSLLLRPEWPRLGVLGAISLLRVASDLLRPWPMTLIVDCVLRGERLPASLQPLLPTAAREPRGLLLVLTLAAIAVFLFAWGLRVAETYLGAGTATRLRYRLAGTVFEHLQNLSLRYHGRHPAGDLLKRITADTDCARVLLIDVAIPLGTCAGALLTMFIVMQRLDQPLAWIAIAAAPLQLLAIRRFATPMEEARSSSHTGGSVYVRTAFTPFAAICAKSASTVSRAGNGPDSGNSRNVPYVTPRMYSLSAPAYRNLP
jgi:ABC-type multidrug transport system fused ATPase/permease subunit